MPIRRFNWGWEAHPEVQRGWEAHPEVREGSEGPPEGL